MVFAFRNQPLRTLYFVVHIPLLILVRVPFWFLISAFPAWRPRRSWTMKRAFLRHATEYWMQVFYATSLPEDQSDPDKESLEPGKTEFVWVDPAPSQYVTGEVATIAKRNSVEAVRRFGYWAGARDRDGNHGQSAEKDERVVLFLHGGGYVLGSAHPDSLYGNIPEGLLAQSSGVISRIFSMSFRLSSSAPFPARNPFPAALLDALSGYYYLVDTLRFNPENIVFVGDSCGAHLAVSLTRYLVLFSFPILTPPRALVLLSPVLDLGNTHVGTLRETMSKNFPSDYIGILLQCGYSGRSLRGNLAPLELETNPWLSPTSLTLPRSEGLFRGFPPAFIVSGKMEVPLDNIRTLRDRMERDMGAANVRYVEYADAMHDFTLLRFHEPERTQALVAATRWLKKIFGV